MNRFNGHPQRSCRNLLLVVGLAILAGCQSSPPTSRQPAHGIIPPEAAQATQRQVNLRVAQRRAERDWQPASDQPEDTLDLWSRIRNGFQLDPAILDNPRIEQQRLVFVGQPRYFELTAERAGRYMHYVVEQLDQQEMPLELALLPFVESAYNPMAVSTSKAAGIWQFIPSTGINYALRQDRWYDGRRDIVESTRAATEYLNRLHGIFDGDWLLALAAYNCGEGCVSRAIARNRGLGLPTDYWNLQLPAETMNYVPKLLALAQIVDSPMTHGTYLPELPDQPYFASVSIDHQLDLHTAADLAAVTPDEMRRLNPAFKQRITAPGGTFELLVPFDQAEQFAEALASLPADQRIPFRHYQVQRGDTLSQIARSHGISTELIRQHNQLNGNLIRVGQQLLLPTGGSTDNLLAAGDDNAASQSRSHQVQPGDNLWSIARQYGIKLSTLKQLNKLDNNTLQIGQRLTLHQP